MKSIKSKPVFGIIAGTAKNGRLFSTARISDVENPVESTRSNNTPVALAADDLFICLRPILFFGKIVIAVPLNGIFHLNTDKLPKLTILASIPMVVFTLYITLRCALSIVLLGLNIVNHSTGIFALARQTVLNVISNACYIHTLRKGSTLCKLFATWREMNTLPQWLGQPSNLKWKIPAIGGFLFCTICAENWINTFRAVARQRELSSEPNKLSFLAAIFLTSDDLKISTVFPEQSSMFGLMFLLEEKLSLYQSAIGAILSISLTIAIESKLEALICRLKAGKVNWGAARQDFLSLCKIIDMVNEIVSVFLFQMLTINLLYTTSLIYLAGKPDEQSLPGGIYTILALLYLCLRFLFLCIPAGNIYGASHRIWMIVQQSSDTEYDSEARRLEQLASHPVGISCMGMFKITHTFIPAFVSTVFTLLILVLQAGKTIT